MSNSSISEEKIVYKNLLSSLFCSASIVLLSILCLINNQSLDIYSMVYLLKTVIPASVCFWLLGFVIGKILDKYNKKLIAKKKIADDKAYAIPSIFGSSDTTSEDDSIESIL